MASHPGPSFFGDRRARPFTTLGVAAIVAAGLLGAALAQWPSRLLVWSMAYLVLVVGVGQFALGAGQASLSRVGPAPGAVWSQWLLLNLGHAGVMGGTLAGRFVVVAVATVVYALAVLWFAWQVRLAPASARRTVYRGLVLLLLLSALTGVALSWLSARAS